MLGRSGGPGRGKGRLRPPPTTNSSAISHRKSRHRVCAADNGDYLLAHFAVEEKGYNYLAMRDLVCLAWFLFQVGAASVRTPSPRATEVQGYKPVAEVVAKPVETMPEVG